MLCAGLLVSYWRWMTNSTGLTTHAINVCGRVLLPGG